MAEHPVQNVHHRFNHKANSIPFVRTSQNPQKMGKCDVLLGPFQRVNSAVQSAYCLAKASKFPRNSHFRISNIGFPFWSGFAQYFLSEHFYGPAVSAPISYEASFPFSARRQVLKRGLKAVSFSWLWQPDNLNTACGYQQAPTQKAYSGWIYLTNGQTNSEQTNLLPDSPVSLKKSSCIDPISRRFARSQFRGGRNSGGVIQRDNSRR